MREDAGPNERSAPGLDEARAVARETFGYETLHRGQDEALGAVLAGRDTLAVMPTGFGKSAIYQIAGVLIPGPRSSSRHSLRCSAIRWSRSRSAGSPLPSSTRRSRRLAAPRRSR